MSGRVTAILAAVALAAAGYVYWVDLPRESERMAREAREGRLLPLDPDDVRGLELPLSKPAGTARVVRGEPEGWRLEEPLVGPADGFAIDGLLATLLALESELEVGEPVEDRSGFGLDPGRSVVVLPVEGDPIRITLGDDTPVGGLRYVEVSTRPGVIQGVKASQLEAFEPRLFRLRDKSLVRLDPQEVTGVDVQIGEALRVQLERVAELAEAMPQDGDARFRGERAWRLRAPIDGDADSERISRLIQDVHFARAQGIVDEPGELALYGLETPAARIRLTTSAGESAEIALGRVEDAHYARVDGAGPVFEVEGRLLETLPSRLFEYRYKRVLSIRRPDVTGVRLSFPRAQKHYRFVANAEEEWDATLRSGPDPLASSATAPEPVQIAAYRVEELLYGVEFLLAQDLVEAPDLDALALDPPWVRVSFLGEADRELGWLELGRADEEQGVPARSSLGDRVWRLSEDLGDRIPLDFETFSRWLAEDRADAPSANAARP